ncbi:type IV pilus assembly PilZ [Alkalidesulfovibrio alkalitolerans DSM 16529]|uniref:Type IV pilus assembly PilZ n=1 Tax=Alkalidesulfovibrio alkalitolerans DSM 16529 TaxID=1121439 RepID=S7UEC6_9BACT|nr:PilZ domain-containing protein [Alkalidesulfovibrio alkalitolerans]EPR30588.1 type IV pilus assembly PilZ [Alkalidesulfovibrio alkalitolerans DSM 16529]
MSIRREVYARLDFLAKSERTDINDIISRLLDSHERSQCNTQGSALSPYDKRQHKRCSVSFPAVVNIEMTHGGRAFYKGKVTDISLGGIRIQLEPDMGNFYENLSLARSFEIVFLENINSRIVTADCTVCRLEYLDHLCIAGKYSKMNLDDLSFIKEVN